MQLGYATFRTDAPGKESERTMGWEQDERVGYNSPKPERRGGVGSLVLFEPVHNLTEDVGAVEKGLTVGVVGSIQQALLNAMGFKVSGDALRRK